MNLKKYFLGGTYEKEALPDITDRIEKGGFWFRPVFI